MKPTHYENQKCAYLYTMFIALQPTTKAIGVTFTYPGSHLVFEWSADSEPDDVFVTILQAAQSIDLLYTSFLP